jgi:intracellular septation protein A
MIKENTVKPKYVIEKLQIELNGGANLFFHETQLLKWKTEFVRWIDALDTLKDCHKFHKETSRYVLYYHFF